MEQGLTRNFDMLEQIFTAFDLLIFVAVILSFLMKKFMM
jgi:hypothetical protein